MELKIEVGKWYKTRNGKKVFIGFERPCSAYCMIGVIEGATVPHCWNTRGTNPPYSKFLDLIEEWKEPKTGVSYVNVFEELAAGNYAFTTKEEANRAANRAADAWGKHKAKRLACARVEWKEGQFDE